MTAAELGGDVAGSHVRHGLGREAGHGTPTAAWSVVPLGAGCDSLLVLTCKNHTDVIRW
jgi:hypothetical protein